MWRWIWCIQKKRDKKLIVKLENLQFQLQKQKQQQEQLQAQLQRQEQNQAQNDTDTISNVGNPTINVNVTNGSNHKIDRKTNHKKQDDCCFNHNEDNVHCNPKNTEKQWIIRLTISLISHV